MNDIDYFLCSISTRYHTHIAWMRLCVTTKQTADYITHSVLQCFQMRIQFLYLGLLKYEILKQEVSCIISFCISNA